MAYLLGLDTSTTATKALVIDEAGRVAAVAATGYPLESPKPGWTEQHPDLFWEGTIKRTRAAMAQANVAGKNIAAVGLRGRCTACACWTRAAT